MASASQKRREAVRARAIYVASTRADDTPPPNPAPFYLVGGVLALAGVGVLAWLIVLGLAGSTLERLLPSLAADFSYTAIPGVLLLLASVPLFFAEMFRRGRWFARNRTFWQGGSVALVVRATPLPTFLAWMLVPVIFYCLLVPVPVLAAADTGTLGQTPSGASEEFWTLVSFYGFVAAGIVGVFLATLLKRATYERLAAAHGPLAKRGRTFWRLISTQWRGETWFSFASLGLFGVLPLLWHDASAGDKPFDNSALTIMTTLAVVFGALAIALVLNAWRSGDQYGLAESIL